MSRRSAALLSLVSVALLLWAGCGGSAPDPAPAAPEGVGAPGWVNDAVMYEVFIPDFSPEGTFRGAIGRLDELQAMGVTTLWLMPIHPTGDRRAKTDIGGLGSPYAVRDYKGVNPEYGGEEQFRAFVDAAHARGMHVIIDWVANHTAWDHPWIEDHPDYYTEGPVDGRFTYPLLDGDTTDWTDVADLNFENEEMRAKMIDAMQYWVEAYDIDGYRCDVAHQVPLDFWEAAIDSVEAIKPVLMLAEAAEVEMHDQGFDLTYAWPFYGTLKAVWEGDPLRTLLTQADTTLANLPPQARRLRFTTNHDETMWDATPPEIFGGQEGAKSAFVLASTMPGIPLLYNGQELGIADTVSFFASTPYDWSQAENSEITAFYSDVLNLYRSSTALRHGALEVHTPEAEHAALYTRSSDDETMVVAVNVRGSAQTLSLPSDLHDQPLTDAFSGETVSATTLSLPPYGYRIFRAE